MSNTNPTILIVDDFKTTRDVIRHTLENRGYNIIEANDGKDALKYMDGSPIDLVITDYNMPNINGAELVDYIRKSVNYAYIPVLVLSTDINEDKKQKAMKAGVTGWIKKPFEINSFIKIIEKILQK